MPHAAQLNATMLLQTMVLKKPSWVWEETQLGRKLVVASNGCCTLALLYGLLEISALPTELLA